MSDSDTPAAVRRPATARPRASVAGHAPAPPTRAELEAIERQQADWSVLSGARVVDDRGLGAMIVTHPNRGPAFNLAARVRWPAARAAEMLSRLDEHMRRAGQWPSIVVSEGLTQPPDLAALLAASGWVELGNERIMWTRHPATVPHLSPALRVEAVTPATAGECVTLETDVFGLSPEVVHERAGQLSDAVETGALRAYLVRLDGRAVASARLAPGKGVAGLHAIGVAAPERRRGYGQLITAIATRAGLATGHGLVWLSVNEANTAAVALYRGLGFGPSFAWSRWLAPAE